MLMLALLSLVAVNCFTTQKKDGRPAFQFSALPSKKKDTLQHSSHPHSQHNNGGGANGSGSSAMFALPHSAAKALQAMQHPVENEDEVDVSFGVVMVSCVLSMALGFGLGYGT